MKEKNQCNKINDAGDVKRNFYTLYNIYLYEM